MSESRTNRRLNVKAIVGSAVLIGVIAAGAFVARMSSKEQMRGALLEQAEALTRRGDDSLALRHLGQYLERHPKDIQALDRYAALLADSVLERGDGNRIAAAIKANERLIRLDPEGTLGAEDPQQNRRWLARLQIAYTQAVRSSAALRRSSVADAGLAQDDRYNAALLLVRELIDRGGDDAEAYRLLGIALEGTGGDDAIPEAARAYETAIAKDPTDTFAAGRLALIYRDRLGAPEKTRRVLDELKAAAPDSPDVWLTVHGIEGLGGDPERADEALKRAAALDPSNLRVVQAVASRAIRDGDDQAAREAIDGLAEADRRRPEIELLLAVLDLRGRQTARAIERLREAVQKSSGTDPNLVRQLADVLIRSDRLEEAGPLIERYEALAGRQEPQYVDLLRGEYLIRASRFGDAIAAFDRAERKLNGPERLGLLLNRGRCKLRLGRRKDAQADFEAAVELEPEAADPRIALADLVLAESPDRAVAELRRGLRRAPDNLVLRRALLRVLLAIQQSRPGTDRDWREFDRAMAEASAIEGDDSDTGLIALRARRRLLGGNADEALAILERGVAQSPDAADLWVTRSTILIQLGRPEEALEVLRQASSPEAAGDSDDLRIARADALTRLGRGREALEVLAEGAASLPIDQRPQVLRVLGRLQSLRGMFREARASYETWARLQPGATTPLLSQIQLAIETGDRRTAERVLGLLGGTPEGKAGLAYQIGRAEILLNLPGGDPAARAEAALEGLDQALEASPDLPGALLLRGTARRRIAESRDDDAGLALALEDFRTSWERREPRAAPPLIALMVRLGLEDRIAELPRAVGTAAVDLDRLAAEALVKAGRPDRAAAFVERAFESSPGSTADLAWKLTMLDRIGQSDQVERQLRDLADGRRDAASWLSLIRYQAARGDREAAQESIAAMVERVEAERPELLRAQALEAIGDLDTAASAYETALADRPEDVETLMASALFEKAVGRPERALDRVDRAMDADPSYRPAVRLKALLRLDSADDLASWQAAWETLGPEPEIADTEDPNDRLTRAVILAGHPDAARRDEVIARLEALIGDQPSTNLIATAARESLTKLLLSRGETGRAVEVAAVTALTGPNAAAIGLYIQALIADGQLEEADRQLERLRAISADDDLLAGLQLRLVETRAGDGAVAEELERAYREAAESSRGISVAEATFRRLAALGEPAAPITLRVARDLAERFPELAWLPAEWHAVRDGSPEALEMADLAIEAGDADAALAASRAALTVAGKAPDDAALVDRAAAVIDRAAAKAPAALPVLAMIRHFQGRHDPSAFNDEIRLYRELLEDQPNNPIYLNNLAWAVSEYGDQPQEALELIDRAIEAIGRRIPEFLDTRGLILGRLERYDEAVDDLTEVVALRPEDPMSRVHLARVQADAGNLDEAREAVDKAVDLGLDPDELEAADRDAFDELRAP